MKVPDQAAGKKVKCPKCSSAIDVPLSGNEQIADSPSVFGSAPPPVRPPAPVPPPDPEPQLPPDPEPELANQPEAGTDTAATDDEVAPPPKSKKKLVLILGGLASVLLLSCCCLGVGGYFVIPYFLAEKNDKVTKANYDLILGGMTLSAIEEKLGPGTATKMDDLKAAYKSKKPEELKELEEKHRAAISTDADYRWRNRNDFIFVIFDKSAKDNGKAVTIYFVANSSDPPIIIQRGADTRPAN